MFRPTFQQCRIVGHAKINYFNLKNGFANKSQDLEYKIN